MPRRRDKDDLHGAISVILDCLDLNLPSPHGELENRIRRAFTPVGRRKFNLDTLGSGRVEYVLQSFQAARSRSRLGSFLGSKIKEYVRTRWERDHS